MQSYAVQQATATQPLMFLLVSSTDHISPVIGAAPAVVISKAGAAFAAPAGAVAEVGNGWYRVAGHAGDTSALGPLLLHATAAGADPTDSLFPVVAYNPQAATNLGLTNLDAAVSSRMATFATPANFGVLAITGAGAVTAGTVSDKSGYSLATPPPTAAAVASAVWTDVTAADFAAAGSPGKVLVAQLGGAFTTALSSVYNAAALANAPTGGSAPTAAAVAAAVWTDATAADFTAAGSIGKSLSTGGIVPGAAGGHFIAGTNATTTVNLTGNLSGSVGSVAGAVGSVTGNVAGSVGSVSAPVSISPAQALSAPRALDAVADAAITVGDALWAAVCAAAGKEAVVGTSYLIQTPSTGTAIRTFTLDNATAPSRRT